MAAHVHATHHQEDLELDMTIVHHSDDRVYKFYMELEVGLE